MQTPEQKEQPDAPPVRSDSNANPTAVSVRAAMTSLCLCSGPRCVATFDYEGEEDDELTFSQGDVITLMELIGKEWGRGQIHGRVGIFPLNFTEVVEPLPQPETTSPQETVKSELTDTAVMDTKGKLEEEEVLGIGHAGGRHGHQNRSAVCEGAVLVPPTGPTKQFQSELTNISSYLISFLWFCSKDSIKSGSHINHIYFSQH